MKTWGLALREQLAAHGIKVSVVCPGFVRSLAVMMVAMPSEKPNSYGFPLILYILSKQPEKADER